MANFWSLIKAVLLLGDAIKAVAALIEAGVEQWQLKSAVNGITENLRKAGAIAKATKDTSQAEDILRGGPRP